MKAQHLLVVLLLLCFSCGTKTISDSEKEKIQNEVKEQINSTIKVLESADANGLLQTLIDSPEFRYGAGGRTADYKSTRDFVSQFFGTMSNQKGEIINDKIWVLDKSTALYVAESKWIMNFKDGRIIVQEPWLWENLMKKVDGKWKTLYGSEFGSEKLIPNPEKQKELNQIELYKQFIGKWKIEVGKDTICLWEVKPFGTGFDCYFQYVSNGKMFMDGKQLWGYDMTNDKFIMSEMIKGMDNQIYAWDFITKTKCRITKFSEMMYPDNAKLRWEVEFKSPDAFEQYYIYNNKLTKTMKSHRVK